MANFLRHIAQGLGEAVGLERSKRITIWSGPSNDKICSYDPDCIAFTQYLKQMGIPSIVIPEFGSCQRQDVQIGFEYFGYKDGLKKLMKIQASSLENNIERCIKSLDAFRWLAPSKNEIMAVHGRELSASQIDRLLEKVYAACDPDFSIPGIDQCLAHLHNQLMIFQENLIGSTFLDEETSPSIDDFRLHGIIEAMLYGCGGRADSLLSHFGSLITHDVDVASFGRMYAKEIKTGRKDGDDAGIDSMPNASSDSEAESVGRK